MQEVAQRNAKNGAECWVVIKDIVYNFTPYLEDVSYRIKFLKYDKRKKEKKNCVH